MVHELVPLPPDLLYQRADLQACQDVIERAQVDKGVHRRLEPGPLRGLVAHAAAHLRFPVQPHHKGHVPLRDWVAELEALRVRRLGQVQWRDNLLDPVGDI